MQNGLEGDEMRYLWTFVDGVITAPAWLLGYLYRANVNTFKYGGACYVSNVKKYWTGRKA